MKLNVRVNMTHPTGERHRGGYGFTREWIVVDVDDDAAADILADPYLETGDAGGGDVEVVTELPTAPDAPAPDVAPAAPDAPAPVAPKPAPKPRKRASKKPKK